MARTIGPSWFGRDQPGPAVSGWKLTLATVIAVAGSVAFTGQSQAQAGHVMTCLLPRDATYVANHASSSASTVVTKMTLEEKVAFLGLQPIPSQRIEEENPGVPRLCVPSLILRDGPVGVAGGASGVTAFPSELNLAATFSPQLAKQYGTALGTEAYAQGTMGIQGPGLNVSVNDNFGRGFENLGEDPMLTSVLGSSLIAGIQSTGEFAMAKHLGVYEQETSRQNLAAVVSPRANEEIYLAPFRAAAHVGASSIMCAIGSTNGVEDCSSSSAMTELRRNGFTGFVRTDAGATTNEVAAIESGVDLFRPFDPGPVEAALATGVLPVAVLNRAVHNVLTVMFAHGDVTGPVSPDALRHVSTPASVATSLAVAEQSMVLLKNDKILPLASRNVGTIAVIGAAASLTPVYAGGGSSQVRDKAPTTDLAGISQLGNHQDASYDPAATTDGVTPLGTGPASEDPSVPGFEEAGLALPSTATGLVDFRYAAVAPTELVIDGVPLLQNDQSSGGMISFEQAIELAPGPHDVKLVWPDGATAPTVTAQPVDDVIAHAAASASAARTAIVVVGERDSEGIDRSTLALPGYQDQLIEAVAAANPRTVVVVHSGGPVLMPWLGSVRAVLEAWYPGQVAGTALQAVLSGAYDPSGRLPVAFPTSDDAAPMASTGPWPTAPSSSDLVALGDLGVGSRWYAAHGVTPLFKFGSGLSYTTFSVGAITARSVMDVIRVRVPVANTGHRSGRYVALANVTYPERSGEPVGQLKGFASVSIAPQHSTVLTLQIPLGSLEVWQNSWRLVTGRYAISVGGRVTSVAVAGSPVVTPQR